MKAQEVQPGVTKKSPRIFITQEDVVSLFGCGKSKAYGIVQEVNKYAKKNGYQPFPSGKANKYLFSDIYKIPLIDIDRVISSGEAAIEK